MQLAFVVMSLVWIVECVTWGDNVKNFNIFDIFMDARDVRANLSMNVVILFYVTNCPAPSGSLDLMIKVCE